MLMIANIAGPLWSGGLRFLDNPFATIWRYVSAVFSTPISRATRERKEAHAPLKNKFRGNEGLTIETKDQEIGSAVIEEALEKSDGTSEGENGDPSLAPGLVSDKDPMEESETEVRGQNTDDIRVPDHFAKDHDPVEDASSPGEELNDRLPQSDSDPKRMDPVGAKDKDSGEKDQCQVHAFSQDPPNEVATGDKCADGDDHPPRDNGMRDEGANLNYNNRMHTPQPFPVPTTVRGKKLKRE
jgi:hypothetical protein